MNNFKSILWTILGIVIFIAIIKFFIFMLPFVIAIGILSYIVFKWKSAVNRRKNHGESYNYYDKNFAPDVLTSKYGGKYKFD